MHAYSCHNIENYAEKPFLQSLDLNPLELFSRGFIKFIVYIQKIETVCELKKHIIQEICLITPDMLQNTWRKLDCCLDVCCATKIADTDII